MALIGSAVSSEVGLRLLLCPLGSNVVVRTACCSVGVVLPVYNTFKAIENKDQIAQHKWLVYWAAYGSFSLAEIFSDKLLSWFPFYYHAKFTFLVWLQLPSVDGAMQLYKQHLRPFLLKHQARLDQIAGFTYSETAKFFNAHQTEIQFAKSLLMKIFSSANQMFRDIIHSEETQGNNANNANNAIEAPRETQTQPPDSEHKE